MIKIKVNEKVFGFEREQLEVALVEAGVKKLNEATEEMGSMKGLIKSSIGSFLPMLGIHKPKEYQGMDNLEFAVRLAISGALIQLEQNPVQIEALELVDNDETTQD